MTLPPTQAEHAYRNSEKPLAWVESARVDVVRLIENALSDAFTLVCEKYSPETHQGTASSPRLVIIDAMEPGYGSDELRTRLGPEGLAHDVAVLLLAANEGELLQPLVHRSVSDFVQGQPSASELSMRAHLLMARLNERVEEAESWNAPPESASASNTDLADDPSRYREAVQALKESEAKFRIIANAMPQMVWSTRPDGFHDYYNQQWYDYTGAAEGTTDGDGWNQMFHPDDQQRAWKAWRHSLATGEPYEIEYRVRHHSGEYRWTLGRALPVHNEAGEITRWMGTCTVIHDQKMAEDALKEASRRKDEFLAMLAHELRNPLAPLYNSSVLLRRSGEIGPKSARALDVIERQIKHMTRLIGDLLDVARVTSGKVKLQRKPSELNAVIAQAVQDFRYLFENAEVDFSVSYCDEPLWVNGDATRIVQAVGNLLHNAAKFTPAGGSVSVRTEHIDDAHGAHAQVTVVDSGEGIEPALANSMFSPFTQADQGLDRGKGGLGLGLALVKGFVELHQGSVSVHSEGKGRGTTFTLSFPCSDAPEQLPEAPEGASSLPLQKLKIVLIEDNRDTLTTLSALLSMDGHTVTTAEDGAAGITAIKTAKPDVVICDIGLPGSVDGYAVARTISERPASEAPKPFLIALSGYGHDSARRTSKASGFDIHLLKPLDLGELNKVLAEYC